VLLFFHDANLEQECPACKPIKALFQDAKPVVKMLKPFTVAGFKENTT
jgi:hypothetical protein